MPVQCRSGSGPLESAQGSCPKIFPGERIALGRPSLRVRRAGELGQHLFPRLRLSLRNGGFATGSAAECSAAEMGFKPSGDSSKKAAPHPSKAISQPDEDTSTANVDWIPRL